MTQRRIQTKKILVASLGVATISYAIACGDGSSPPARHPPGNLMAPDRPEVTLPESDGGADATASPNPQPPAYPIPTEPIATSGNLMPPVDPAPVTDAGAARDAGAATKDAGAPKDAGVKPTPKPPLPRPPTSGNLMAPVERTPTAPPKPRTK